MVIQKQQQAGSGRLWNIRNQAKDVYSIKHASLLYIYIYFISHVCSYIDNIFLLFCLWPASCPHFYKISFSSTTTNVIVVVVVDNSRSSLFLQRSRLTHWCSVQNFWLFLRRLKTLKSWPNLNVGLKCKLYMYILSYSLSATTSSIIFLF